MNCKTLIAAINSNISEIESMATGYSETTLVKAATYPAFIALVNTALYDVVKSSTGRAKAHDDISSSTAGVLISGVNTNLGIIEGQAELFNAEDPPFFPKLKQLYIGGLAARVIAQQDSWKIAMTFNNDILYLSADNGVTWPYFKTVPFVSSLVRMGWVFKNGRVVIGIKGNKMYSSEDLLTTVTELTVKDTDGDPLVLHTPEDEDYPGTYYGAFLLESYVIGGKEVLTWGSYWQPGDIPLSGATPINIYSTTDINLDINTIYKFGDNALERDDGTDTGGATGEIIGDVTNSYYCHHFHYAAYNPYNDTFYFLVGDHIDGDGSAGECGILTAKYNSTLNTWGTFVMHPMNINFDKFRMAGMRFLPDNKVMWTCDSSYGGGIYLVDLVNLFSTDINDHTVLFLSGGEINEDMIGLSDYEEFMVSTRFSDSPSIVASNDFGSTWQSIPDNYFQYLTPDHFLSVQKPYKKDSDGYILMHNSTIASQCTQYSFLMKLMNKP